MRKHLLYLQSLDWWTTHQSFNHQERPQQVLSCGETTACSWCHPPTFPWHHGEQLSWHSQCCASALLDSHTFSCKWINVVEDNSYPRSKPVGAFLDDLNSGEPVTRIQANLPGQGRFGKIITPSGDDDLLAAWSCPSRYRRPHGVPRGHTPVNSQKVEFWERSFPPPDLILTSPKKICFRRTCFSSLRDNQT